MAYQKNNRWIDRSVERTTKYIDKDVMQEAMRLSIEGGSGMNNELAKHVIDLLDNIMYSSRFHFEEWQSDMFYEFRSSCLEHCIRKFPKYNEERSSAFSFYTTVIINHLRDEFRKLNYRYYLGENIRIPYKENGVRKSMTAVFVELKNE